MEPELLEKIRASVKEAGEQHQASLPAATKWNQYDKAIGDIKWYIERGQKQLDTAQEQREWWAQKVQAIKDSQEVLTADLGKAEEAKNVFMLNEGIQEPKENKLKEPTPKFELFTQETKDFVFTDTSEKAKEMQKAIHMVQAYVTEEAEARRAYLLPGWNDGKGNPEEISDDEGPEEEGEDDEEMDMEEFKKKSGGKPQTVEDWQNYRKEQKEKREKEATPSSKHTKGKFQKEKKNGKKNGLTLAAKKNQDAADEGK